MTFHLASDGTRSPGKAAAMDVAALKSKMSTAGGACSNVLMAAAYAKSVSLPMTGP
jgi:hypothetical protein